MCERRIFNFDEEIVLAGREKPISLWAWEEPGQSQQRDSNTFIYIYIIYIFIHGFLLCFALAPLPFLSVCLRNV